MMITYTGIEFDPLNPETDKIDIKDIAHALSMICRANGHFKHFYSVGQHSLNCCIEAKARGYSDKVQLACLLHDAGEAYIADLIRPVKEKMPEYIQCEEKLLKMIYEKFRIGSLTQTEKMQVKKVDDDILFHEFLHIKNVRFEETVPVLFGDSEFSEVSGGFIEKEFLNYFKKLSV